VRLPEPVHLAPITKGRSDTGIGPTNAETDVPPALLDGIRRCRPFRYVAFREPHGTLAGEDGRSELSITLTSGEAESALQEGQEQPGADGAEQDIDLGDHHTSSYLNRTLQSQAARRGLDIYDLVFDWSTKDR